MRKNHITIGLFCLLLGFSACADKSQKTNEQTASLSNTPISHTHSMVKAGEYAKGAPLLQQVSQVYIPEELDFAGERVPIEDYNVRERFDRELTSISYRHSHTIRIFKLANRWFPVIEKILAEQGVPDDFKYLAVAESGLENVISPKNARGFWQFLKDTGKSYGLDINKDIDERYHIEKSTLAACQYFKKAHNKFGIWTTAAGSYNMGMGGINNQITRQEQENYFDLYLNSETSRYVFRILAYKQLFTEREKYGFNFSEQDLYPVIPFKTVEVDSISDIADFAKKHNTSYRHIKLLNPWMINTKLSKQKEKKYTVKVPDGGQDVVQKASFE